MVVLNALLKQFCLIKCKKVIMTTAVKVAGRIGGSRIEVVVVVYCIESRYSFRD